MKFNKQPQRSNAILSAVLFICILSGVIKISMRSCFYENKLNTIFIQESQVFYINENLFHLGRDYVYRLTTSTETYGNPNILLTPRCFRSGTSSGILNFNSCFSLQQIVPSGFPVSITNANLTGGPVFFNDTKTDTNDERYKAEVFLASQIQINSVFIPNWTSYGVQLFEVERNPLCDFQIFSEGDTALIDTRSQTFTKPIYSNGNFLCGPSANQYFNSTVNIAGHLLHIPDNGSAPKAVKTLFNDAPGRSSSSIYSSLYYPFSTGASVIFNGVNYLNGSTYITSIDSNFESTAFGRWQEALKVRQRNVRPTGFDPTLYNSLWPTGDPDTNNRALETANGPYCLVEMEDYGGPDFYKTSAQFSTNNIFSALRGLNAAQTAAKLKLSESQKGTLKPGTIVVIFANTLGRLLTFYDNDREKFPYALHYPQGYDISYDLDDKALRLYQKVVQSGHYTIDALWPLWRMASGVLTTSQTFNQEYVCQEVYNGKLFYRQLSTTELRSAPSNGQAPDIYSNFLITRKSEPGTENSTNSPYFIIRYNASIGRWENFWSERVYLPPHPIFIYDKNRRRWIQLIDLDISQLCNWTGSINGWNGYIHFTRAFLNKTDYYNGVENNYKRYNDSTLDIRLDYRNQRKNFWTSYNTGNFSYPFGHPTGVGIRIINGSRLPTGGLTISASFPVYIQGDFNTVNVQAKAAIHADSITVLSNQWQDWASAFSNESLLKPAPSNNITINAHLVTGTPHPDYESEWNYGPYLPLPSRQIIANAGFLESIRTLENWRNYEIILGGSLILPFRSKIHWEPWVSLNRTWDNNFVGNLSPVRFSYNNTLKTSKNMPFYYRVQRGRKTRLIGATDYNYIINSIVNTTSQDWDSAASGTYTEYRNLLPNYLR